MTVQQVSSAQRTNNIRQTINDALPVVRQSTASTVPLGPVQRRQDPGPVIRRPGRIPQAIVQAEQVVARRLAMVLGEARANVPRNELKPHEIRALARTQVGRNEAAGILTGLRRQARIMRARYQRAGNTELASVAHSLSRAPVAPGPISLGEALAITEATKRLQAAAALDAATVPNIAGLEQTPDGAVITEFYIGFTHDLLYMVGPDFEPSGFKFYLTVGTPALDNSNAIREIEVPLGSDDLIHDTEANTYFVYFGEIGSDLDPGTEYTLWATAHNPDGDSVHSSYVSKSFTAGVRGDLNGDGAVNMIDVNLMLDILLDGSLPYARADMNQDGENTQEDLDLLIDVVNQ